MDSGMLFLFFIDTTSIDLNLKNFLSLCSWVFLHDSS